MSSRVQRARGGRGLCLVTEAFFNPAPEGRRLFDWGEVYVWPELMVAEARFYAENPSFTGPLPLEERAALDIQLPVPFERLGEAPGLWEPEGGVLRHRRQTKVANARTYLDRKLEPLAVTTVLVTIP